MKYSLIITAWDEAETVGQTFERILNEKYKNLLEELEIILVAPDEETLGAAEGLIRTYKFKHFIHIKDPQRGKPVALNLALERSTGDILIFTDGDVVLGENVLEPLVKGFENEEIGGISGRPVSADPRTTMFGYWGNLLADVAHITREKHYFSGDFYFMSGYLYAIRRFDEMRFPEDILVDDAWATVYLVKKGYKIGYAPDARVYVKYARNFSDWIKQKKRSLGGYHQLKNLEAKSEESTEEKSRKFFDEVKYMFFPLKYARSARELLFSIMLFPARTYLWTVIWYERKIRKKSFTQTWMRIESTKGKIET